MAAPPGPDVMFPLEEEEPEHNPAVWSNVPLAWGQQLSAARFGGYGSLPAPPGMGAPSPGPDTGLTAGVQTESAFVADVARAAEAQMSAGAVGQVEALMRENGVDIESFEAQAALQAIASSEGYFQEHPDQFSAFVGELLGRLAPATPYTQALEVSGFTGDEVFLSRVPPPHGAFAGYEPGTTPDMKIHPQTGWLQFRSGVLVDPNAEFGAPSAVFFPTTESVPGSPTWLQNIQTNWSGEKVGEWRRKLVDMGYLDPSLKKGDVADVAFLNALSLYHRVKYQNRGKAVPWSSPAGGPAVTPFNFGQMQAQVRNDVRLQYRNTFGDDPTDTELEKWEQFIISQAKKLYQRGQLSPEGAAAEAEERFIERFESSPQVQYFTDQIQENTRLRDSMMRAAAVTSGMTT